MRIPRGRPVTDFSFSILHFIHRTILTQQRLAARLTVPGSKWSFIINLNTSGNRTTRRFSLTHVGLMPVWPIAKIEGHERRTKTIKYPHNFYYRQGDASQIEHPDSDANLDPVKSKPRPVHLKESTNNKWSWGSKNTGGAHASLAGTSYPTSKPRDIIGDDNCIKTVYLSRWRRASSVHPPLTAADEAVRSITALMHATHRRKIRKFRKLIPRGKTAEGPSS